METQPPPSSAPALFDAAHGVEGADPSTWGLLWVWPERRFTPLRDGMTVGRGSDATHVLAGNSISRLHARFHRLGAVWELEDLESRNGSRVDGSSAGRAPLLEQSVVRLGDWVAVVTGTDPDDIIDPAWVGEPLPGFVAGAGTAQKLAALQELARAESPLLLLGEEGSGKEVLARGIHQLSGCPGRYTAFNPSVNADRVEAELFGYAKDGVEGTPLDVEGSMHTAHLGTLFIDYLPSLSAALQTSLARVLEVRLATPVGRTRPRAADFRLVAAASEPLARGVLAGRVSAELAARFGTDAVTIPPLRQRREDVPPIFEHALRRGGAVKHLTPAFVEALCLYDWPFNVRELVQLAWLLSISSEETLHARDLPERFATDQPPSSDARARLRERRASTSRKRGRDWDENSYA
jgi:transcriptional regulator of acetoin/glycerol metabolism